MKWALLPLVLMLAGLSGCAKDMAPLVVDAPNHGLVPSPDLDPSPAALRVMGIAQQFHLAVGPPEASLYVRIMDPPTLPPRGTILILHGVLASSDQFMSHARYLSAAGYRAVLVDLRGHGRSTGPYITFGVQESADLVQVLNALEARKLAVAPVGAMGFSYGAAVAIQLAARDPRIAAVIAIAPFATMRSIVPSYGRTLLPAIGWRSDADYNLLVDAAGRRGGFNPDQADTLAAIQKLHAPVLLIHGSADAVIPVAHSERLHAAAPAHSEFVAVPGGGHASIWLDLDNAVRDRILAWLDRRLAVSPEPLSRPDHPPAH